MLPSSTPSTMLLCLTLLLSMARITLAGDTRDWKSRSIYQVFTDRFNRPDGSTTAPCNLAVGPYCGGTWSGVIDKLDYIQGMGFTAIMISPVTENLPQNTTEGSSYHGYWPQNIYELNSNFGTRDDLKALVKALHARGMFLMVDTVVNDMGFAISGNGKEEDVDYSVFVPFNNQQYFHPYCNITDYNNYTDAQTCWLGDNVVALPDLHTELPEVVQIMGDWVKDLIANYSIDGLRIDAAKHVNNAFLSNFSAAAGIFSSGEVYEGNVNVACPYQDLIPSIPNYPVYFPMIQAFTDGNISALSSAITINSNVCKDTNALGSFSENHDLPRFASYTKDLSLAQNVLAFTMMMDGIPMIYQGQEQHFSGNGTPFNREALWTSGFNTNAPLYNLTATLNRIRSQAIATSDDYLTYQSYPIYTDASTIVMRKGFEGRQTVTVLSSSGERGGPYTLTLPTAYQSGLVVTDVLTCTNLTVSQEGQLNVPMDKGLPHVFFPAAKLNGSELCGMGNWSSQSTTKKGPGENSGAERTMMESFNVYSLYMVLAAMALWFF